MVDYKCGQCGKTFMLEEFNRLQTVSRRTTYSRERDGSIHRLKRPIVEKAYICDECSYVFGVDPWRVQQYVVLRKQGKDARIKLSTIFTEVNVGTGDNPFWYETKIIGAKNDYVRHYQTKEEAIEGHFELLKTLRARNWDIEFPEKGVPILKIKGAPAFSKAAAVLEELKAEEERK